MDTIEFEVDTRGKPATDLSRRVEEFCDGKGDGLVHVFAPHATAGLALIETGAGSEDDLHAALQRILPRDDALYRHRHGSRGHGADHVLPAIVAPFLLVPVVGSRPALGTWQSIVLVDLNEDNPRRTVRLTFVAG